MQEYKELYREWPLVCKLVLVAIVVAAAVAPAVAAAADFESRSRQNDTARYKQGTGPLKDAMDEKGE